jgi:hypothetical protein
LFCWPQGLLEKPACCGLFFGAVVIDKRKQQDMDCRLADENVDSYGYIESKTKR